MPTGSCKPRRGRRPRPRRDRGLSVTVIEWGGGLAEGLAEDRLEVAITQAGQGRAVRVTGTASGGRHWGIRRFWPCPVVLRAYGSSVPTLHTAGFLHRGGCAAPLCVAFPVPGGAVAEQGSPPPPSGRLPAAGRRGEPRAAGRRYWDEPADTDEETPPWAGPGVTPQWADQGARQPRAQARPDTGSGTGPAVGGDADGQAATWPDEDTDRPAGLRNRSRLAQPQAAARSRRRSRITWVWGRRRWPWCHRA
jgi:hypothetical protein